MDLNKRPPEHTLELFADPACVKDMIKGSAYDPLY